MPQHAPNDRPSDKQQKQRTFRNKMRQRARHAAAYPNDKDSLSRARRWITPTQS